MLDLESCTLEGLLARAEDLMTLRRWGTLEAANLSAALASRFSESTEAWIATYTLAVHAKRDLQALVFAAGLHYLHTRQRWQNPTIPESPDEQRSYAQQSGVLRDAAIRLIQSGSKADLRLAEVALNCALDYAQQTADPNLVLVAEGVRMRLLGKRRQLSEALKLAAQLDDSFFALEYRKIVNIQWYFNFRYHAMWVAMANGNREWARELADNMLADKQRCRRVHRTAIRLLLIPGMWRVMQP